MQRSFTRNLGSLEPLFDFIGAFAARERLDDGATFALSLAVEELFTNMVKYGGGSEEVSIDLSVSGGDLVVLLDHVGAEEFDPAEGMDVDTAQPLSARTPGGIGLHLVRKVMDSVTYEHRDGAAHLRLTKHLGGR